MRTGMPIFLISTLFSGPIATMAQLPPEILADSYLLRVEQAIRDGDRDQARAEIDKIILLRKEQELKLSEEFLFRYAKAAAAVDRPDQALESVMTYLMVAGRDSQHYVEALELMNQMQDAIAGRNKVQDVSPGTPASPQTIQGSNEAVPPTGVSTDEQREDEARPDGAMLPAEAPAACDLWNTEEYFKSASLEYVQTCLEAGTDVTARTEDGHTPLHMAAQYNEDPAIVQFLLAHGADLNAKTSEDGHMPLHEAAAHNSNPEVLQALLEAGADPLIKGENGTSLLCWAANNENLAIVEILLQVRMDPKTPDDRGYTPLHWAAATNENPAVLQALLTAGAELMARAKDGRTPLHSAALRNESLAVYQLLLGAGADVAAQTEEGDTPLHWAARNVENPEVLKALLTAGADPMARGQIQFTPLHWAARENENPEVLEVLLTAGADLEARDEYQNTPLHWAAVGNENSEVIQVLLAAGADLEARGQSQDTPLHRAAEYNENPEVIQMLLGGGAILEARDRYGYTPLLKAANDGDLAVVEALLAAGANLKARSNRGLTVLHVAVGNDLSVIQAILERGLSTRARDSSGETPLHRIWSNLDAPPAVVQALLAAGADLEARDEEGDTPLHKTVFHFVTSTAIVALLDAGADAGAKNDAGKTPWDLAQEKERLKGSDAYWRLNEARFEASGSGSRRTPVTRPSTDRNTTASAAGGPCLIPGYPSPPGGVANLGLPWCPATVGFQARAFALQAAGAQCAIATGISSTPEQIQARRQEIKVTCERLAALGVPNCRCP